MEAVDPEEVGSADAVPDEVDPGEDTLELEIPN